MVANSATRKQPDSSRPGPGKQDVLEMLLAWCELATEIGLVVEQLYNPDKGRFSVRVGDVMLNEGMLMVVNQSEASGQREKNDDDSDE